MYLNWVYEPELINSSSLILLDNVKLDDIWNVDCHCPVKQRTAAKSWWLVDPQHPQANYEVEKMINMTTDEISITLGSCDLLFLHLMKILASIVWIIEIYFTRDTKLILFGPLYWHVRIRQILKSLNLLNVVWTKQRLSATFMRQCNTN